MRQKDFYPLSHSFLLAMNASFSISAVSNIWQFPFIYYTIFSTSFAVHHLLHQIIKNLHVFVISCGIFPVINYLKSFQNKAFLSFSGFIFLRTPEKYKILNNMSCPAPIRSDGQAPVYGNRPAGAVYGRYGQLLLSFGQKDRVP